MSCGNFEEVHLEEGKIIQSLTLEVFCKDNDENSFLRFTPECIEQIGPYHQINLRDQEIFDFLVFVGVLKKGDKVKDKLSLLYKWAYNVNNLTLFKPFNKFVQLFMTCKKVIEDEYIKRKTHLKHCVCLSNSGHTFRLHKVEDCFDILSTLVSPIAQYFNYFNRNMFQDSDLCKYYLQCKYAFEPNNEYFNRKIQEFTNLNFNLIEYDAEGKFKYILPNKNYNDFLHFLPFHPTVKEHIENLFFKKLTNFVHSEVNSVEKYDRTQKSFLSCIEVDAQNNFKKIGVDYDKLRAIFFNKITVRIDPLFLEKLVEEKFKVGLYKACFTGLLKYHQNLMFQICRNLDSIQMDSEIKDFLKYLCGLIPSSGILSTLNFSDIESIKNAIKTFPLFGKAYSSFVQSTPPPEGTKTTGDFNKDMKHLPLDYLIQFIVYYEKNWKDFQSAFELTPKRSKSQKPKSANKKQKLINK
jgi:hypothetical protein